MKLCQVIIAITLCIAQISLLADGEKSSIKTVIKPLYLSSFSDEEPTVQELVKIGQKEFKVAPTLLSERELHNKAFEVLFPDENNTQCSVLPAFVEQNHLLGNGSIFELLVHKKRLLKTIVGEVTFLKTVTAPLIEKTIITKAQHTIKKLSEQPNVLKKIDSKLTEIASNEAALWNLLSSHDETWEQQLKEQFPAPFSFLERSSLFRQIQISNHPFAAAINGVLTAVTGACSLGTGALGLTILLLSTKKDPAIPLIGASLYCGLITAVSGYGTYQLISQTVLRHKILSTLHKEVNHIADLLSTAKELYEIVHTAKIFKLPTISYELETLLSFLTHSTFLSDPSIFSLEGRTLVARAMINQLKNEIISFFQLVGVCDLYSTLAHLMKKDSQTAQSWCFAEFTEHSSPSITTSQLWHPTIDPEIAIPNNIQLGENDAAPHMIITGPNTAGKSTIMEALCIGLIFAQTVGIAPAHQFTFTPFNYLACHLNIKDDISTGTSLFKAEVNNAKQILNSVRHLPEGSFAFFMADEMFRSTDPDTGAWGLKQCLAELCKLSNCCSTVATHYHTPSRELEAEYPNKINNYHISVIEKPHGFKRTFNLKKGISPISSSHVAQQIFEEHGLLSD